MRLEREGEFWEIELDELTCVIRSGRVGTRGKTQRVTSSSAEAAQRAHDEAVIGALAQGYRDVPGPPPPPGLEVRDPALEQALREHRDQRDAYLVYADWLQAHGNPAGELIALAVRLEAGKDPRVQKRVDALCASLRLPLPDQVQLRWRHGMWRSLRIENARDRRDGPSTSFRAVTTAREVFRHVLCGALEELVIGALQWGQNYVLVPELIAEAGRHAWARGLARLHVGDVRSDPDPAYYLTRYDAGKIGRAISTAFPDLRVLRVHAGFTFEAEWSSLEGLELPALRELAIAAGWFGDERMRQLAALRLPALERLELWIGGGTGARERVAAATTLHRLLDGTVLPTVRHLALRGALYGDELAAAIAEAPIGARLVSLDLSGGTLGDEGARALLAPGRLPALDELRVDECYVSTGLVRALAARFPRVSARDQRPPGAASYQRTSTFEPVFARPRRRR